MKKPELSKAVKDKIDSTIDDTAFIAKCYQMAFDLLNKKEKLINKDIMNGRDNVVFCTILTIMEGIYKLIGMYHVDDFVKEKNNQINMELSLATGGMASVSLKVDALMRKSKGKKEVSK